VLDGRAIAEGVDPIKSAFDSLGGPSESAGDFVQFEAIQIRCRACNAFGNCPNLADHRADILV
jgi:hypothetical protein